MGPSDSKARKINVHEDNLSEIETINNLNNIERLDYALEANGKKIKIIIDIVYPSETENIDRPFFVVNYHGASDNPKTRELERVAINQHLHILKDQIFTKSNLEVRDFIIMGDFNENLISTNKEMDLDVLSKLSTSLGRNAKLEAVAPPKGIIKKMRGDLNQPYNLYINPQIRKDQLNVTDDSKSFVLRFSFSGQTEDKIDLQQFKVKTSLPVVSFLDENTHFRDHFNSQKLVFQGVTFKTGGYLPTKGVKAIRDPKNFFNLDLFDPRNHKLLLSHQQKSTKKLFSILFKFSENPTSGFGLQGQSEIGKTLKVLNDSMKGIDKNEIIKYLVQSIKEWTESKEYYNVIELLIDTKKAEVNKKMGAIQTDIEKIVEQYKSEDDFDLIGKLIQLCGQKQQQEMSGGYSRINGQNFPGPEKVDRAQASHTAKLFRKLRSGFFYISQTEASKNKSKFFHARFSQKVAKNYFYDIVQNLKNDSIKYPAIREVLNDLKSANYFASESPDRFEDTINRVMSEVDEVDNANLRELLASLKEFKKDQFKYLQKDESLRLELK